MQEDHPKNGQPNPAPSPPTQRPRKGLPALLFLLAISFLYIRSNVFRGPKQLDIASLNLKTLNGKPLDPAKFKGKAAVLNFWAPWCGPCQIETPWLQRLQAAHPGDLIVIGVDEDPDTYVEAALFAASRGATYPIVQKSGAMVNAIGAIDTVPTTFYITSSGKVVHTATGAISDARMEDYARDAIRH